MLISRIPIYICIYIYLYEPTYGDPCIPKFLFDSHLILHATAKDLIRRLLLTKPEKRLSSAQVMEHPWIAQYTTVPATPLETGRLLSEVLWDQIEVSEKIRSGPNLQDGSTGVYVRRLLVVIYVHSVHLLLSLLSYLNIHFLSLMYAALLHF